MKAITGAKNYVGDFRAWNQAKRKYAGMPMGFKEFRYARKLDRLLYGIYGESFPGIFSKKKG